MSPARVDAILTDLRRRRAALPPAPAEKLDRWEWIARNKREYEARRKAKR